MKKTIRIQCWLIKYTKYTKKPCPQAMRMPISAIHYAPSMVFLTPSFLPLVTICSNGVPPFFPCFSPGLNYHLGVIFCVIQVIWVIFLFLSPKLSLNGPKSVHRDSTADTWRKYFGASQSQSVRIGKLRYFGSKTRDISWDLSEFVMSSTTIWGSKSGSAISTTAMIKPRGVGNWHRFVDGRSEITWLPIFLMRKVCLSKEMWHSASAQTWKTMEDSKSEYTFPKAACEPTINHSLKWYWMILM